MNIKMKSLTSNFHRNRENLFKKTVDKLFSVNSNFEKPNNEKIVKRFQRKNFLLLNLFDYHGKNLKLFNKQFAFENFIFMKNSVELYSSSCYSKTKSNLKTNDTKVEQKKEEIKMIDQSFFAKLISYRVLTVPNLLTYSRILLTPLLGYLVVKGSFNLSLVIFIYAGLSDLLDGLIARNLKNQTSALGSFLDPLADKLLVATLFLSLSYIQLIPASLMLLVISRDIALTTAGFYIRYATLRPKPKSLKDYLDPSNESVKLKPTLISKLNTAVQLSLVGFTLASPVFPYIHHTCLFFLWCLTATTTVTSGISYLLAKDTILIMEQIKKDKKQ